MTDMIEGIKVVDCDTHFQEPADLWTSRVPAKFKDKMPHVRRVNVETARASEGFIGPAGDLMTKDRMPVHSDLVKSGEIDRWYIRGDDGQDKDFGWMTLWIAKNGQKNRTTERIATIDAADPGSYDTSARLAAMDKMGVWAHMMYPNVAGFGYGKAMLAWDDLETRNIFSTTYNDGLADMCADSNGRLYGQAVLPVWDQESMMKEARRCIEKLGMRGFVIADRPELLGLPNYHDPHWAPLFDLCNTTGVPLAIHIGNSQVGAHYQVPWESHMRDAGRAVGTTLLMMYNAGPLANFLVSGLFDKYTNLKIVSVESGIGWIPYMIEQLEYQIDQTVTTPEERSRIGKRSVREYFHDHFYSMFWGESLPIQSKDIREFIGVENILFETDYPHYTSLYPTPRDHIVEVTKDLDDYTKRRILQDNAVELFQLDLPKS